MPRAVVGDEPGQERTRAMMEPQERSRRPSVRAIFAATVLGFGVVPFAAAARRAAQDVAPARWDHVGVPDQERRLVDPANPEQIRAVLSRTAPEDFVVFGAWPLDPVWLPTFLHLRRLAAPRRVLPLGDERAPRAIARAGVREVYGVFLSNEDEAATFALLSKVLPAAESAETLTSGPGWRFQRVRLK
jgi:hypothetical protein